MHPPSLLFPLMIFQQHPREYGRTSQKKRFIKLFKEFLLSLTHLKQGDCLWQGAREL